MQKFDEWLAKRDPALYAEAKKWLQKAINPEHKGFCTPMSKATCTPRRKALAKRFKKGDLHNEMAGSTGAIVGSCKPGADYQVMGACSDLKKKKKVK